MTLKAAAPLIPLSPRLLGIAFALFLGLFALDVFSEGNGFRNIALAVVLHLIPAAILLTVLAIAWYWDWVGAVLFALAAG